HGVQPQVAHGGGGERAGELEGVGLGDASQDHGAHGRAEHGFGGDVQRRADDGQARGAVAGVEVGAGHGAAGGRGGGASAVEADDLSRLDEGGGVGGDPLALGGALVGAARDGRQRVGDVDRDNPSVGAAGELCALHLHEVAPDRGFGDAELARDVRDVQALGGGEQREHVVPAGAAVAGHSG